MDLATAIESLPEAYRTALKLKLAGARDAAVGAELGIELEAVTPLLRLAHAKLMSLLNEADATSP